MRQQQPLLVTAEEHQVPIRKLLLPSADWIKSQKSSAKFAETKPAANITAWHLATDVEDSSREAFDDWPPCELASSLKKELGR